MAGPQFRFATLIILLVAIACSCSVSSVAAEARVLRQQVHESDDSITQTDSVVQTAIVSDSVAQTVIASQSSSASDSGSGSTNTSATINTAASAAESTEKKHDGPTTMSFVGPALAGVLAIVLIGAVVAFKNRMGK